MRKCATECINKNKKCKIKTCRLWIDYGEDMNCTLIAVAKNGNMTLHQVGERLKMSFVRVKQIQDYTISKMQKKRIYAKD